MDYKYLESVLKNCTDNTTERELFLRCKIKPILGDTLTEVMISKGFCKAPASTKHHGNYPGGLFDHSLAVACCLQKYTEKLELKWDEEDSPIRIGMLHDLCKIDVYKKNSVTDGYEHDDTPIIKGHGDKSVIYAFKHARYLTDEEIACIVYHMGAYETDRWKDYDNAIKHYPNVLFTHMADMEASKIMGV